VAQLRVPEWSAQPELWAQAIELVQGEWPPYVERFIHRDYHPMNVLWNGDRASGIVDWPNACRGPAGIDPAWCRMNLADSHGLAAADRFLEHFCAVAGSHFTYNPFWDLIALTDLLPGPPAIYPPWEDFGLQISVAIIQERMETYLRSLMARFA
jgi:aminoglycoside phosphotransferase (APT) family kinase protein